MQVGSLESMRTPYDAVALRLKRPLLLRDTAPWLDASLAPPSNNDCHADN